MMLKDNHSVETVSDLNKLMSLKNTITQARNKHEASLQLLNNSKTSSFRWVAVWAMMGIGCLLSLKENPLCGWLFFLLVTIFIAVIIIKSYGKINREINNKIALFEAERIKYQTQLDRVQHEIDFHSANVKLF